MIFSVIIGNRRSNPESDGENTYRRVYSRKFHAIFNFRPVVIFNIEKFEKKQFKYRSFISKIGLRLPNSLFVQHLVEYVSVMNPISRIHYI